MSKPRLYIEDAEMRATTQDGKRYISGLAVVFNSRSVNLGGFTEIIDERALDEADMTDVVALFNHDPNHVLGRSSSGTLKLKKTSRGLEYTIELPDTQVARDLYTSIERGDVRGSSFAFNVKPGGSDWSQDPDDGGYVRTVKKMKRVLDVSPVTYPAYPETDTGIGKRMMEEWEKEQTPPPPVIDHKLENEKRKLQLLNLK